MKRRSEFILIVAALAFGKSLPASAQTAIHTWYGSNSTDWADSANWSLPNGAVPGNVTTNVRLQVQTIPGGYDLIYGAAQGTTVFDTTAGGTPRSFLLYSDCTFRIQGGTFVAEGASADLIGVNAGLSKLIVEGGTYIRTNDVSGVELQCGFYANSTGMLQVTSGSASVRAISLGANNSTAYGEIWASGGTLEVGSVTKGTGNGGVFLDGGVLKASQDNADWIGSGLPVRITGNGAFIDTAGYDVGIQRHLVNSNGAGGLFVTGGGRLTITAGANNSYAGDTIVSNATLRLGANSGIPNGSGSGNVYLLNGGGLDLGGYGDTINGLHGDGLVDNTLGVGSYTLTVGDNNQSSVFTGRIQNTSGTLNLTKTGTGTLTLGGSNSYDGVTAINNGVLIITDGHALGSAAGGTTVANGRRLILSGGITVEGEALTISGTGGDAQGALRAIDGVNEWTGPITLAADMSRIAVQNGATLIISGTIGAGGNGYGLRVRGPNGDASVLQLSGANTYGGATELWQGIVRLAGGDDRLPTDQSVLLGYDDGANRLVGHLDLNGQNQRVAGLTLYPNITDLAHAAKQAVTNSAVGTTSILTVSNEADCSFGGRIVEGAGSIALVKKGGGTLSLDGNNTYAGPTTVEAGTLAVNGTYSGGGLITVQAGGSLGGTGSVSAVTLAAGGRLSPGNSAGTLTLAGNLDLSAVGTGNSGELVFELGVAAQDRVTLTAGILSIGAGALGFDDFTFSNLGDLAPGVYTLFATPGTISGLLDAANLTGSIGVFSGTLGLADANTDMVITIVPEPGTLGALGLGMLALALRRRRR